MLNQFDEAQPQEGLTAAEVYLATTERGKFVARLEGLSEADWSRSALHPRLQQPMRMVDLVFFTAEHDDYHVARISELIRLYASK